MDFWLKEETEVEGLDWSRGVVDSDGIVLFEPGTTTGLAGMSAHEGLPLAETEELDQWDMYLPLAEGDPQTVPKVAVASCDGVPKIGKTEVTFTKGIEELLEELNGPLTVVHNVDPREAAAVFEKLAPSSKEGVSLV